MTNVNDAPAFAADPTIGTGATEDIAYIGTLAGTASDIDAVDTLTYSKVTDRPGCKSPATARCPARPATPTSARTPSRSA